MTIQETAKGIKTMEIRGAGRIARAAAAALKEYCVAPVVSSPPNHRFRESMASWKLQ